MTTLPRHTHKVVQLDWQNFATIERVREALRIRTVFPEASGEIDFIQTHISSVLLTPRYVFKFKRPVDVGFADFRSLEARLNFCHEEMRLNRRLAPDVYLDVLPLQRVGKRLSFGGTGEVGDYAVVMARLPADQMLDTQLRSGIAAVPDIERIADTIAEFHSALPAVPQPSEFGGLDTWRQNWGENFAQTLPEVGTTIEMNAYRSLEDHVHRFLDRHQLLFERRIANGFVRDGHGDLRCEHICTSEPIRIIDCIEFNQRFRIGDVANDLAFLLMDLCAFGRPDFASGLLHRYLKRTQNSDAIPLIPFYCCYRAFIRGKVLGMRLRDHDLPAYQRARIAERARAFFVLAEQFARQMGPPVVLVMCGLMGSGKSSVAEIIASRTGATVLSSDRLRKEIAVCDEPARGARSGFAAGLYTPTWTQRTYDELFARAKDHLQNGRSVVLDATFGRRDHRERATALGQEAGADVCFIECTAPDDVLLTRLAARERAGTSISDGRPELYLEQKSFFEPITASERTRHRVVRTDQSMDSAIELILGGPEFRIPEPLFGLCPTEFPSSFCTKDGHPSNNVNNLGRTTHLT